MICKWGFLNLILYPPRVWSGRLILLDGHYVLGFTRNWCLSFLVATKQVSACNYVDVLDDGTDDADFIIFLLHDFIISICVVFLLLCSDLFGRVILRGSATTHGSRSCSAFPSVSQDSTLSCTLHT